MMRLLSTRFLLLFLLLPSLVLAGERWHKKELIGHVFRLQSDTQIQEFTFSDGESAFTEYGNKKETDGAMTGRVITWHVDIYGQLHLYWEGREYIRLKKLRSDKNLYVVKENGVERTYLRSEKTETADRKN